MAHMIDFSNDRQNIAFVGKVPWHGLGTELESDAPYEDWVRYAGHSHSVLERPLYFPVSRPVSILAPELGLGDVEWERSQSHKILVRSDTGGQLGVVSKGYKPVQPKEILTFFKDLVSDHGFVIDVAGSLAEGRKLWALARTGENFTIFGQDRMNGYLLLVTSYDGSLATTAMYTTVRVVCNNTLQVATLGGKVKEGRGVVKVNHRSDFNHKVVHGQLGIGDAWKEFEERANTLAERKLTDEEVIKFLVTVLGDPEKDVNDPKQPNQRGMKKVLELYQGKARGSHLRSCDGSAWGMLNAVTEFSDFERQTRGGQDARLSSAWFGNSARTKEKAATELLKLAA